MAVTTFPLDRSVGALNDANEVVIVPSPAAGVQRMVRSIYIANGDSSPVVLTLSYAFGANRGRLWRGTLNSQDTLMVGEGDALVLSQTTDSIVAVLDAPVAVKQPDFTANWGDRTVTP